VTPETHHPKGANDVCLECGQHVDARIHHTPERLSGQHKPAIGERMLLDPLEEGANLIAAAITPRGHGWTYAARFTKEALRDLIAAGWTPPAREASDEESKLRAELESAYARIAQDGLQMHQVTGEIFALTALRNQLVHDVFATAGLGDARAAEVRADTEKRYSRKDVADLLKKVLDRCDRAKDSAQKQHDKQTADWEETTARKMVGLAERLAASE
jgi:hypothetical protein